MSRLRPWLTNVEVGLTALGLAVAGTLVAAVWVWSRRPSMAAQARLADRDFALAERLTTALEIQTGHIAAPPALARRQLDDALRAAALVDVRDRLPLRMVTRDWLLILLATALLALAVTLPNPQADILGRQRALGQAIARQQEALQSLAEAVRQDPNLEAAQRNALLEPIESALEALEDGDLSREEVVAVLSEAEADLRSLASDLDQGPLREALSGAGSSLAETTAGQDLGESLAGGDLAGSAASANRLADELPGLSAGEKMELAERLADAAAALAGVDPALAAQLAEAAAALDAGDDAAAGQALREAAASLQDRAQQQRAAAAAAAAAAELGAGRAAVAGAGETPGQPGLGEPGSGGGLAEAPGSGPGQPGSGGGIEPLTPSEPTGPGGPAGPAPGGGHAEPLYVPPDVDLSGVPGEAIELPAICRVDPTRCGSLLNESPTELGPEQSLVPYSQVFSDYRDAAYEALEADYIPLGLKSLVRDYFSSLEP